MKYTVSPSRFALLTYRPMLRLTLAIANVICYHFIGHFRHRTAYAHADSDTRLLNGVYRDYRTRCTPRSLQRLRYHSRNVADEQVPPSAYGRRTLPSHYPVGFPSGSCCAHLRRAEYIPVVMRGILNALIGMEQATRWWILAQQRHAQGALGQLAIALTAERPAHHAAAEQVDYDCVVKPPRAGLDVGEVARPMPAFFGWRFLMGQDITCGRVELMPPRVPDVKSLCRC